MSKRTPMVSARDVAAYLLDRADQYVTESACWVALADAAHNVLAGEVQAAKRNGELDAELYERMENWNWPGGVRKVEPTAGVDE